MIQYLKDGSTVILDATCGKTHLATTIDEQLGITLESTLTKLQSSGNKEESEVLGPAYATMDNGPMINWYLDMKGE